MSVQPAVEVRGASAPGGKVVAMASGSTNYRYRKVLNRENADAIKVVFDIPKSKFTPGCCQNIFSCCPCCTDDGLGCGCGSLEEVVKAKNESTYTWVMENRVEINRPMIIPKSGCCAPCCLKFQVFDNIRAYYFDDEMFDFIEVKEPKCCPPKMCFGTPGDKIAFKTPLPGCPPIKCCTYPVEVFYVTLGEGNDTAQIIKTARDNARAKMS